MHHVKSTILVALMIASLAVARGIPRVEDLEEDNNNNNEEEEEEEETVVELAAADPVIGSTPTSQTECALAANAQTERTSGSMDQGRSYNDQSISDKMDGNRRINIGRRMNLDRIRNAIMRASSYPSNNIWQILDNFDWMRPSEMRRESLASIISNLLDPLMPPQIQYVDNTLRLMAIKNSMDDLLANIFPNLHMIQHPTEHQNSK